jgi:hypothetical protein
MLRVLIPVKRMTRYSSKCCYLGFAGHHAEPDARSEVIRRVVGEVPGFNNDRAGRALVLACIRYIQVDITAEIRSAQLTPANTRRTARRMRRNRPTT